MTATPLLALPLQLHCDCRCHCDRLCFCNCTASATATAATTTTPAQGRVRSLWGVCGLVVALASNLDCFFIFEEGFELGAGPDAILRLSGRNFEARVSESFEGSVFGSTSNRRLPRLSLCTLGRKL